MFKRLQPFSRSRSIKKKKASDGSVGESLREEDCFTLEIPAVVSDKGYKDDRSLIAVKNAGHLGPSSLGGNPSDSSTVSSITANSGSIKVIESPVKDFSQREIKTKHFWQSRTTSQNSIAATLCTGDLTDVGSPKFNAIKQQQRVIKETEESPLITLMNRFLPTCCGAHPVEELELDDRSDIALVDQDEMDILMLMSADDKYSYAAQQAARRKRSLSKMRQQQEAEEKETKKFLWFLRRSRTNRSINGQPSVQMSAKKNSKQRDHEVSKTKQSGRERDKSNQNGHVKSMNMGDQGNANQQLTMASDRRRLQV